MTEFLFPNLFSPVRIGPMELRNRLVMPAMHTNLPSANGEVTQELIDFYRARARGGVGLIVAGFSFVHPQGRGPARMLGSHDDGLIPGLRRLTEAVHAEGAKVALQLCHVGRRGSSKVTGMPTVAASPLPPMGGEIPLEITHEQIAEVVEAFARAGARAKAAGFDAVELHMAHGFLLSGFLSLHSNRRTDEYGGSLENRAKFPIQVLSRVIDEAGGSLAVTCKMNGCDFVDDGITPEEAKSTAHMLEQAGMQAITVSAATDSSLYMSIQPAALPRGCLVPLAQGIKSVVKIPVITVGRINNPYLAEEILSLGKADLVAIGRALICDPDLPNKTASGRMDDIRPCIACGLGCALRIQRGEAIGCVSNARAGRGELAQLDKAAISRRVVVVGGGPAGLEAARVAASRGHKVVLLERSPSLGGLLGPAAKPPYKYEIPNLVEYYVKQLRELGVEVQTRQEATIHYICSLEPDVLILATGGKPVFLPSETEAGFVVTATDILEGIVSVGKRVAVVGGNSVGCETAEWLAETGHQVTVLEMTANLMSDNRPEVRRLLEQRLAEKGGRMLTGARVIAIRQGMLVFEREGKEDKLEGLDNVVMAAGLLADDSLLKSALELGIEAYSVGDGAQPGNVWDAVHSAYELAASI